MSALSWNCHGGMGNLRTVRQLQDLASRLKPNIIFLMEVKINIFKMEKIKLLLHYEGLFYVQGGNRGGGLALLWKERGSITLLSYSRSNLPWCCLGDINDLLSQAKKRGRFRHPFALIQGFHEAIDDCNLKEVCMQGYTFT